LRLKIGNELIILNSLVVILVAAIIFSPSNIVRLIVGLPFVLFCPGYALVAALFTRKKGIGGIERATLSFGMSIVVVPLIGLTLNYTPWGIRLEPILYSVATFIFVTSAIAWFRRRRLAEEERFRIELRLAFPGWSGSTWDKTLSILLVISIVGALGMFGYAIAKPKSGEQFAEFYLLGLEGKAAEYPSTLKAGDEGKVLVGVVSRWRDVVDYRVEVRIDGVKNNEVGPIILRRDEKWEQPVSFTPQAAGPRHKVEFLLYKLNETEPCVQPLWLWIDVTQ
jgi:uncharacterized membrane protein